MPSPAVTRFAPSPTGYIHVGNLRTALMNCLIARKTGGSFVLRLDDTDRERSKQEYADAIMEDLDWLGLHWDRVERQSARLDRYREEAARLRERGRFYECFESPGELDLKRRAQLGAGRPPVYDRAALSLDEAGRAALRDEGRAGYWRFLLDRERVEWVDGILGPLSIDAASVSDPVLIRADGQVLYTFASSVDDVDMGITHIVRGADHVTNTATQIQIMRALGGEPPAFAHHSLLTGARGEELSKRLGTLSLRDLRAQGVEAMALLSLMARLGSSKPVEPAASLDELAEGFDLSSFGAAPTRFDAADLVPLSRTHLHRLPFDAVRDRLAALGVAGPGAGALWPVVNGNIDRLADFADWWRIARDGPGTGADAADAGFVAQALALLPARPWGPQTWAEWTAAVAKATGRKGRALYLPLRLALTGRAQGPDMGELLPLLEGAPLR